MHENERKELFNARRRVEAQRIELANLNKQVKNLISQNLFLQARCEALEAILKEKEHG